MIQISNSKLKIFSILYLYVPILIWIATWARAWFAILGCGALGYMLYRMYKNVKKIEEKNVTYTISQFVTMIVFILMLAYICGWGGFTAQCDDFPKHNAVLQDLATKSWPVYYNRAGVESRLSYYIAHYIVSGLIGKIAFNLFGLTAEAAFHVASYTLLIWNCLGLFLVINHFLLLLKNPNRKLLYIAIFFLMGNFMPFVMKYYSQLSGADMGYLVARGYTHVMDFGRLRAEYTPNFILLRWVFQYCLPTWIVMSLFFESKDESEYVAFGLPLILFAPFCLIGIIPFMLLRLILDIKLSKSKEPLMKCFSIENIITFLVLTPFVYFMFKGNIFNPDKPADIGFKTVRFWEDDFSKRAYIFMMIADVVIFVILCIVGLWKKKTIHWIYLGLSTVILLVLPYFSMGLNNDFVSRASIPALFVVYFLLLKLLKESKTNFKDVAIVLIILSSVYNFVEISVILNDTDFQVLHHEYTYVENTLERNANPYLEERLDFAWNYYDYMLESNPVIK